MLIIDEKKLPMKVKIEAYVRLYFPLLSIMRLKGEFECFTRKLKFRLLIPQGFRC